MNATDCRTNEPPLTFHSTVPRLYDTSIIRMASLLWHQSLLNDYPWRQNINETDSNLNLYQSLEMIPLSINNWNAPEDLHTFAIWKKSPRIHLLIKRIGDYSHKTNDLDILALLNVKIPTVVERRLEQIACQMGIRMSNWITRHFDLFEDRLAFEMIFVEYFDCLVWRYEGKPQIALEQTAKNLMKLDKLSDWDKFKLACEFCFVDDIRTLWPLVSKDARISCNHYREQAALYYWIRQLNDDACKVPTLGNRRLVEEYLIRRCSPFHNRNSVEYFWNFVRPRKQVRKIISCLKHSFGPALMWLFEKLDEQQWHELMNLAADDVIIYMMTETSSEHVMQLWRKFKHRVSGPQFFNIVSWIFDHEHQTVSRFFTRDECVARSEVWIEAPPGLKQHALDVLTTVDDEFFDCFNFTYRKLARPMDFFILVLSDATAEQRDKIWRDNWPDLIRGVRPSCVNEIMQLCLGKQNVEEFKKIEMTKFENIKEYCVELTRRTCLKELDIFLDFIFSSDSEKISNAKNRISKLWKHYAFSYHYSRNLGLLD